SGKTKVPWSQPAGGAQFIQLAKNLGRKIQHRRQRNIIQELPVVGMLQPQVFPIFPHGSIQSALVAPGAQIHTHGVSPTIHGSSSTLPLDGRISSDAIIVALYRWLTPRSYRSS